MVVRRRKKYRKRLGERTYHGNTKNRRGKGIKGGKGAAGPKNFKILTLRTEKKRKVKSKAINVGDLASIDSETVDLNKMGVTKLLGRGTINKPITVIVRSASRKSVEKIEAVGGKVITNVSEGS